MSHRPITVLVTADVHGAYSEEEYVKLIEGRLRGFASGLRVELYRKPADVGDLIDPTNMSADCRSPKEIMAEAVTKLNEEKARLERDDPPPFGGLPDARTYRFSR